MKKILNVIFSILKFILFFISFGISFYIILFMYQRLDKSIVESFNIFIPYLILITLFIINIILKQSKVNDNLFYNLTCTLVFSTTIVIGLRAIFDKNMVLNTIMGYNVNFFFFSDYLQYMNVMMYGLILSNILFMFKYKEKPIAKKVDIEVL